MKSTILIPLKVTDTKKSRNKKEKFKTITFYDVDNNRIVKTYVVSGYGNYTKWKKVINYDLSSDTAILQGNFKYADIDIIDADSTFKMDHIGVSFNDVADMVPQYI